MLPLGGGCKLLHQILAYLPQLVAGDTFLHMWQQCVADVLVDAICTGSHDHDILLLGVVPRSNVRLLTEKFNPTISIHLGMEIMMGKLVVRAGSRACAAGRFRAAAGFFETAFFAAAWLQAGLPLSACWPGWPCLAAPFNSSSHPAPVTR